MEFKFEYEPSEDFFYFFNERKRAYKGANGILQNEAFKVFEDCFSLHQFIINRHSDKNVSLDNYQLFLSFNYFGYIYNDLEYKKNNPSLLELASYINHDRQRTKIVSNTLVKKFTRGGLPSFKPYLNNDKNIDDFLYLTAITINTLMLEYACWVYRVELKSLYNLITSMLKGNEILFKRVFHAHDYPESFIDDLNSKKSLINFLINYQKEKITIKDLNSKIQNSVLNATKKYYSKFHNEITACTLNFVLRCNNYTADQIKKRKYRTSETRKIN